MRAVIAAILPRTAGSHKLPLLLLNSNISRWSARVCFIFVNLNSIVFDFLLHRTPYGTRLTLHILGQLPAVPPGRCFNTWKHVDRITTMVTAVMRAAVLELTCAARDLTAFVRDPGHRGPLFVWNSQHRLHPRAELNALFFLYGITSEAEIRDVHRTFSLHRMENVAL